MMRGQWYEDVYSLSICHFVPFHLVRLKFVTLLYLLLLFFAHFRWVIKFMEKTLVCSTR